MSITPFLPGLPALVLPEGEPSAGEPSDGQPGFGDAFAAALAGALAVPAAPLPVLTSVATVAAPPVESGLPTRESGLPTRESGVPTAESGLPTRESALPARESGLPTPAGPTVPAPLVPREHAAGPEPSAAPLPSVLPAAPSRPAVPSVAAAPDATPLPVPTPDSTVATPNSTVGTPNSTVATPNSTVGRAVVEQVFPEVTRMVSTAGNGTHRITLTLQPEQLGEVRVTLVVRDGAVHVRLAGGDGVEGAAVHRALAGGAPELQRLLERTGTEARVSVRDPVAPLLPASPAPPAAGQPTAASTMPGAHPGPDAQAQHGAREGQAREQAPREQPTREQPRRQEPRQPSYVTEPTPVTGRLDRTV